MLKKHGTTITLFCIYLIAGFIQWHILLNWDVSLLMHASDRLFAGGKYGIDFFDTDPPIILYIYAVPVFFAKWCTLNFSTANFFYTFFISMLVLVLSDYVIRTIETAKPALYKRAILLPGIAAVILLPPAMDFAQREHLTIMLILPYLLLTAARMEHLKIASPMAWLIGGFAALGFAIKPYFYGVFILIECYYVFKTRKKPLRPETILISLFALIYVLSIILFHKTYITMILPIISKYYYQGLDLIMWQLIVWLHPAFMLSLMPIAIFFVLLHSSKDKILETILMLGTAGFCFVYLIQKTYWYYHVLPAFTLSLLLLIQLCYRYKILFYNRTSARKIKNALFILISFIFIFHYPVRYIYALNAVSMWEGKKGDIAELIHHLKVFKPHSTIYFFSGCLLPYPAVDYLHFQDRQLAQTYWFLPGMVLNPHTQEADYTQAKTTLKNTPLLQQIIQDLIKKQPDLLVVDNRINCNDMPFQFLNYFSENTDFKNYLKQYHYVDGFETVSIYKRIS